MCDESVVTSLTLVGYRLQIKYFSLFSVRVLKTRLSVESKFQQHICHF